jgi:hypothetical protein
LRISDFLIEQFSPKEDTFSVPLVPEDAETQVDPLVFRVARDYEEWIRVGKEGAAYAEKLVNNKLPASQKADIHAISKTWDKEIVVQCFIMSRYVVDTKTWNLVEFLALSKKLGIVYQAILLAFESKQIKAIPTREKEEIEELKND